MDVPPSPKFQAKPTRLPEAMAVDVDGENVVPLTSHSGAAEKLMIGGGKIPSELVREAIHPILLIATSVTEYVPLALYVVAGCDSVEVTLLPRFQTYDTILPLVIVEVFVNCTTVLTQLEGGLKLKFGKG